MLALFKQFLQDEVATDFYITGRAGTGKTTDVRVLVEHCLDNEICCVVTAYTHIAVSILESKMPAGAKLATLHSFLGKRPTINDKAEHAKYIEQSTKVGKTEKTKVLFIDEYSMIGEKDFDDLCNEEELKIVWIGDPYQLPPVMDRPAVIPSGEYQIVLTEIKRQAKDNPLGGILKQLVDAIEGAPAQPLKANNNFIRGIDIQQEYNSIRSDNKIILAFTNECVEEYNALIQGRTEPIKGDKLYSPTTRETYVFEQWVEHPTEIVLPFGDPLGLNSKYKTLEYLITKKCRFAEMSDGSIIATMFGHYNYKCQMAELKDTAAESNRTNKGKKAAWREFLSFNDCIICLDFCHAMTVHKSQGSTIENVFVDMDDLFKASYFSMKMYLKLAYVAMSRASKKVWTN